MNDTLTRTLASSLEFLQSLARDGARPEEAKQRLRLLQDNSLGIKPDLLWKKKPTINPCITIFCYI